MSHAAHLRQRLSAGELIHAPGAADALTARLVQDAGFAAVYMTGFGATAARLGMPDLGLLTQTEMADHARNMTRAVTIPVIADADNGYGGPSNIERTIDEYSRAGVAALHLEDQESPKRCGQMSGITLMEVDRAERHVRAAVEARGDRELLLIGRTDSLGVAGVDEAVRRAERYRDAGAEVLFVDGIKTVEHAETIARRLEGPKAIAIVTGNETESLTPQDLRDLGYSMVFHPLDALFAATRGAMNALARLRDTGMSRASEELSYADFVATVGIAHHQRLDDSYGG